VYLMVASAPPPEIDPSKFQYIRIVEVRITGKHDDQVVPRGCDDSCIFLVHEGNGRLKNDRVAAVVLGNDRMVKANITTLNAGQFPKTRHFGAEHVSGPGSEGPAGSTWDPGEEIYLDLNEKTLHTGDLVTVRIIDRDSNIIISEDTTRA
jgi:hypothetical protein